MIGKPSDVVVYVPGLMGRREVASTYMSQSGSRKRRRMCKQFGHVPKFNGNGKKMCARCGVALELEDS